MKQLLDDEFLDGWLERYDRWMEEGKIPFSSKVVPVGESFTKQQWVMPSAQVFDILRNARTFAVAHCVCRRHYRRCNHPVEVCFFVNDYAEKFVSKGLARHLPLEEAREILKKADESGLVHLTLYRPDQYVYAVCSCCSCCCHDLQLLLKHGRDYLVARSEYIARTDSEACTHCGVCVDRCVFGARLADGERVTYDEAKCYGCGLCVSSCPAEATTMVLNRSGTVGCGNGGW